MNLEEAIYTRRSIKSFSTEPVDKELVKKIISYGTYAPTACNIQGYKFIIIDDADLKKWLVDSGAPIFIKDAPFGILVLYDNRTGNIEYNDYIQSGSAVIQNMLLGAHSLGLGACWICRLPSQKVMRKMFKIANEYDIIAYLALGYPKTKTKLQPLPRKYTLEDSISFNEFKGKITKSSIKRRLYLMVPRPLKLFYRLCFEGRFFKKK